jgi:hypothetical protein
MEGAEAAVETGGGFIALRLLARWLRQVERFGKGCGTLRAVY